MIMRINYHQLPRTDIALGDITNQALRQIEKASTSYMSISSVLSVLYPARDHSRASSKIV